MNIAFYIDEMNFRGVANSTYQYSYFNELILKNKSIIFYNKKNQSNKKEVITKFKKKFKVIGIDHFNEIELNEKKFKIDFIYTQKGGEKNHWISYKIKTLVHCVYPQNLKEIHGHKYACISEWISKIFTNNKIPFLPYIVQINKSKQNLKKKLKIKKNQIVFGCHGGESSFDLKFVQDTLLEIVKKRKDIVFLFLNIDKFCKHSRIIFLKGTSDETYKKKFLNTCDSMIYGRSLGESFGMSCAEFAVQGKKIISYKFNRHKSHIYNLGKKNYEEYSSRKSLFKLIDNYKKKSEINFDKENKYLNYSPKKVMKIFNEVFFKDKFNIRLSPIDYLMNYLSFIKMHYRYIRHKIYNHYYYLIESKIT